MPANSVPRMDSSSSGNESNVGASENVRSPSPIPSTSRMRTESASSDKHDRFVLPSIDGSPPKVMTLNEVEHVVKNIQNMELAHEIALNPDFKLLPYEPPEDSLERRIKDIMHKAFWDVLREQLKETPPCYDHAIQLLADIKECFPQIISPSNKRALDHINEVLDTDVIRQQAEQGVLDFKSYAEFVVQIMAKSCAPARDDAVKQLADIDDVVETFKGILDTMSLMKLDMTNYLLDFARNDILANSVEYEREKFKEYLEYYKFGFPATENWLQRNQIQNVNNAPSTCDQTMWNAYMELMDYPESKAFPEVLSIDQDRILKLGQRAKRLTVGAALISICTAVPVITQRAENRVALATQIEILLQNVTNEKEISEAIDNIWEQIRITINGLLEKEHQSAMDNATVELVRTQILQAANKEAPVRALMWKRLQTYFRLAMRSKAGLPPPPPGYFDFKEELEAYASALKRVIGYNHSVFGEYLTQVLEQQLARQPNESAAVGVAVAADQPSGPQVSEQ